jgi:hypothetical protein
VLFAVFLIGFNIFFCLFVCLYKNNPYFCIVLQTIVYILKKTTMKKDWKKRTLASLLAIVATSTGLVAAQDLKGSFSAGADLVSSYVWRGVPQDLSNKQSPNLQPYASFNYGKLTIGAWGSTSFTGSVKEVDLYATFAFSSKFALTLTDYNWTFTPNSYFKLGAGTDHVFEATLAYTGGESFPISASVNTMFAGADKNTSGDQAYSTYIEVAYPVCSTAKIFVGGSIINDTPIYGSISNNTLLYGGAGITNLGMKVTKELKFSDSFSLPVYGMGGFNFVAKDAYLLVGLSF